MCNEESAVQIIEQAASERCTKLDLSIQRLKTLPPEIGKLTSLEELALDVNNLVTLPPEIGNLINLKKLRLSRNRLITLPPEIANLTSLKGLWLYRNRLTTLPPEIGNLASLEILELDDNPLTSPSPEIVSQGTDAIMAFLRGKLKASRPQWISKLLMVGEGGVGKTSLLRALHDKDFNPQLATTHGIEIDTLELEHPSGRIEDMPLMKSDVKVFISHAAEDSNIAEKLHDDLKSVGVKSWLASKDILPGQNSKDVINKAIKDSTYFLALLSSNSVSERGQVQRDLKIALDLLDEFSSDDIFIIPVRLDECEPVDVKLQNLQMADLYLSYEKGLNQILRVLFPILQCSGLSPLSSLNQILQILEPDRKESDKTSCLTMQLKTWDFGGQEIYHATHQFFLTNRSLFLLVWNARHGYEQGRLYYWLNTIQAKAPDSPILLVATHIDERDADLPLKDFRSKYPQIIGQCELSNKTGEGIEALRKFIADAASNLPLMGEKWPETWLDAADAIRNMKEKYITPQKLWKSMRYKGIPDDDAKVLTQWLHDLGDILFFQDDRELDDIVVLKPQWVSEYISQVLEDDEVIKRFGILTRERRDELWDEKDIGTDIGTDIRDHFIRLMERFDLSYRTLDNKDISLVVERLSFNPPDYEEKWNQIQENGACREISMKFKLNTIPPGIPTWFIARSHRFTTYTHWRLGALFADVPQKKHMALVQSFPHDRYLQLTVRGPYPHNFFVLLKDGLELTFARFPGLKIDRLIPCPCHNEQECLHEFRYEQLLKRLERKEPKFYIECPESLEEIDVRLLLFGLISSTFDDVHREVQKSANESAERHTELLTLLQRQFAKDYQQEQSKIESYCPNVFVLRPLKSSSWMRAFSEKIELQLYCQSPGCWHPTKEGGRYEIGHPANWLRKMGPYIQKMVSLLKYVSPLVGPWVNMTEPEYEKLINDDIKFMQELVKIMPDIEQSHETELADALGETIDPGRAHGAALRELRMIMDAKDPKQDWGGLRKVLTPEGHYLWLCEYHAKVYNQDARINKSSTETSFGF